MSNSRKKIEILFNENPELLKLVPNPIIYSGSPFISALSQKISALARSSAQDDIYKIVFKKSSSRELMTINNGELKGLFTSTCIEKGKISAVAGLQKIDIDLSQEFMPVLLGISLFESIQNRLTYISTLCADIRNHQIVEEHSRFERISETIVDSFLAVPDLALDKGMRDAYLARTVKNNDDCFEMYISQREQFRALLSSEFAPHSTGFDHYFNSDKGIIHPDQFFERKVLTHPVFSLFERLAAGKICEIIISGNYNDSNIERHRNFLSKAKADLFLLMQRRLEAFDSFTEQQVDRIENDLDLSGHDRKDIEARLECHKEFVQKIKGRVSELLDSKLESFDILLQLTSQDDIDVFLIDGHLLVNAATLKV